MGPELSHHQAGEYVSTSPDDLFHRETDRVVWRTTGKRPMEVGADKIARAALSALRLLESLRRESGQALPLAWSPGPVRQPSVIEVYPAMTLRSRGLSEMGYKGNKPMNHARREGLVASLGPELSVAEPAPLVRSDDALDAALCLMAAADFLNGYGLEPEDMARSQKEGWIWFRQKDSISGN